MYIRICIVIHSSINESLACFHLLSSLNTVAMNIDIHISESLTSTLLGIYLDAELQNHIIF